MKGGRQEPAPHPPAPQWGAPPPLTSQAAEAGRVGARGPRAAVGGRGAEQHVAGQGLVQNRTSGTAEGGAPAMAAYTLV